MEALVVVPFVWAMGHLGGKVNELRRDLTEHQQQMAERDAQIQRLQENTAAYRVAAWSGAAISAGLLAANLARYWMSRDARDAAAVAANGPDAAASDVERSLRPAPPASYTPQLCPDGDDEVACVLCLEHIRDTLVLPCGHLGLCWTCASRMRGDDGRCPICRGNIGSLAFVFHA
uniref:RING-type domain-containing protein n=1 Tax=Neobodo designis TaxID=312471 RepID=A0A7S1W8W5_NEODS|mmetsp:Transcript_743/g.2580  ORF Transcript_743/g.2580 Transcript_743/m.2580 type:complete len:175 (+) Transcript_743:112-636(+)